jgi:TonB family protein
MILASMLDVRVVLAIALLLTHAPATVQRGRRAEPPRPCAVGTACCPYRLMGFCRVGRPGPPPTQIRRVPPNIKALRRPYPSGTAILEIGINEKGRVVSACVLRGVRDDFDNAAQAAALESLWTPKVLNGKPVGVVMTVTFVTPDLERRK